MLVADNTLDLPVDSHCVLVAGPGTGKTYQIGERVKSLVDKGICNSEDIEILTLTQSAARKLDSEIPYGRAGTFHSFSLRWLNTIGDAPKKRIVDNWEQENLVVEDLRSYGGTPRPGKKAVSKFLIKLGTGFRENQTEEPQLTGQEARLREGWLFLRGFLNFRLFDELSYDLLRHLESGAILEPPPRTILVDEYQDLTPSELALLRAIATKHETTIFACGDDRQAIYGFREADPFGLNNFCAVYGIEMPVYLSLSRRCPDAVCNFAEEVAAQIPEVPGLSDRPPLQPHQSLTPGEVTITTYKSTIAEVRAVHTRVVDLVDGGTDVDDIMIIVPTHLGVYLKLLNQTSETEESPLRFYDVRTTDNLTNTDAFRTLYSLTRLAANSEDQLAWRALIHLAKGWGPSFMQKLREAGTTRLTIGMRGIASLDEKTADFLQTTTHCVDAIRTATDFEALLLQVQEWYKRFVKDESVSWLPILELPTVARALSPEELPPEVVWLKDEPPLYQMLAEALLAAVSTPHGDDQTGDREVAMYTVHQAKGLQAEHVFLLGGFTQAFVNSKNPADGVRLLYVAVARAKATLEITMGRFIKAPNHPLSSLLGTNAVELSPHITEAALRSGVNITTA